MQTDLPLKDLLLPAQRLHHHPHPINRPHQAARLAQRHQQAQEHLANIEERYAELVNAGIISAH